MSEAWRAVVEYQVLINGQWEDRKFTSDVYSSKASNGPMGQANSLIRKMEAGKYYEGAGYTNNLVRFTASEVTVLAKYKEESDTWKRV